MSNVINANTKAQGNSLFKSLKNIFVEDGLMSKSLNRSIDKVANKAQSDFKDVINVAANMGQVPGVKYADPKDIYRNIKKAGANSDPTIKGFSKLMDNEMKEKIVDTTAKFATGRTSGINPENAEKMFSDSLSRTKRKVASRNPLDIIDQYFVQPFRDSAVKGIDSNVKKEALTKGIGRATVATGATVGAASMAIYKNDETNPY